VTGISLINPAAGPQWATALATTLLDELNPTRPARLFVKTLFAVTFAYELDGVQGLVSEPAEVPQVLDQEATRVVPWAPQEGKARSAGSVDACPVKLAVGRAWKDQFYLDISNSQDKDVTVKLTATDPEDALSFTLTEVTRVNGGATERLIFSVQIRQGYRLKNLRPRPFTILSELLNCPPGMPAPAPVGDYYQPLPINLS